MSDRIGMGCPDQGEPHPNTSYSTPGTGQLTVSFMDGSLLASAPLGDVATGTRVRAPGIITSITLIPSKTDPENSDPAGAWVTIRDSLHSGATLHVSGPTYVELWPVLVEGAAVFVSGTVARPAPYSPALIEASTVQDLRDCKVVPPLTDPTAPSRLIGSVVAGSGSIDPELVAAVEHACRKYAVLFMYPLTELPILHSIPGPKRSEAVEPSRLVKEGLREQLAERDGNACHYCGVSFEKYDKSRPRTLDHLVPYLLFPTWDLRALVLACGPCNGTKSNLIPTPLLPLLAALVVNQVRLMQAPVEKSLVVVNADGEL